MQNYAKFDKIYICKMQVENIVGMNDVFMTESYPSPVTNYMPEYISNVPVLLTITVAVKRSRRTKH